ncbi:MAG: hypothetical protein V2A74_01135, partial [bacterium]
MKTLTQATRDALSAASREATWTLRLDLPGGARRYSSRPLTLDGIVYEPLLLEVDGPTASAPRSEELRGIPPPLRAAALLVNYPELSERSEALLDEGTLRGVVARLALFVREPDAQAGTEADLLPMGIFGVERVEASPRALTLHLISLVHQRMARPMLRRADLSWVPPQEPPPPSAPVPHLFGYLGEQTLFPFRPGWRARLLEDLQPESGTLVLDDSTHFPNAAFIQVGDEFMAYYVKGPAGKLGSNLQPLNRSQRAFHRRGTDVALIPAGGFELLVADHPCQEVSNLHADDRPLTSEETCESVQEDLAGRIVEKIRFARWPVDVLPSETISRLTLGGAEWASQWEITGDNTALNPIQAVDAEGSATSAVIESGSRRLSLRFLKNISDGERRYGPIVGLALKVDFIVKQLWVTGGLLRLRVGIGGGWRNLYIPRPEAGEDPTEAAEPRQHYAADLSDLAQEYGWNFFPGAGTGPIVELGILSVFDDGIVHVQNVEFEVQYRARTAGRLARRIKADVKGRMAAAQLLENPSEVLRELLTHSHYAGIDVALLDGAAFDSVRDALAARGDRFAARWDAETTLREALDAALWEAGVQLSDEGALLKPAQASPIPDPSLSLAVYGNETLLDSQVIRRDGAVNDLQFALAIFPSYHAADAVPAQPAHAGGIAQIGRG